VSDLTLSRQKDLGVVPPPPPTTPGETKAEGPVKETATGAVTEKAAEPVEDEAYWRGRMATLRGNLARDQATCEPISAKVRDLDALYADSIFYIDGKAMVNRAADATIETKRVDARAELQQCAAKVALDQTAISTAEEEARRLNVLAATLDCTALRRPRRHPTDHERQVCDRVGDAHPSS